MMSPKSPSQEDEQDYILGWLTSVLVGVHPSQGKEPLVSHLGVSGTFSSA